jgi:hypothetical protein
VRARDVRRRRRLAVSGVAAVALLGAAVAVVAQPGATRPSRLVTDQSPRPFTRCAPSDLRMSANWARTDDGELIGLLTATNPTGSACDLLLKPWIYPLLDDGSRAMLQYGQTLEGRYGDNALLPGESASAVLHWAGWCGAHASGRLEVGWGLEGGGTIATVTVDAGGQRQPTCVPGTPSWAGADWFTGLAPYPTTGAPSGPLSVTGLLEMAGGPGGADFAVPGRVRLSNGADTVIADTDASGTFTAQVAPGTWTVTGTSPSYSDSRGTCFTQDPVQVTGHSVSGVRVLCSMK